MRNLKIEDVPEVLRRDEESDETPDWGRRSTTWGKSGHDPGASSSWSRSGHDPGSSKSWGKPGYDSGAWLRAKSVGSGVTLKSRDGEYIGHYEGNVTLTSPRDQGGNSRRGRSSVAKLTLSLQQRLQRIDKTLALMLYQFELLVAMA